jgi:hypothetical protein
MFFAMELLLILHKTTASSGGSGRFGRSGVIVMWVCSFSLLDFMPFRVQIKRTKRKGTPPLVPPEAGYPALLALAGRLQTRCAQTVQAPYSAKTVLLGGVTMGENSAPFRGLYGASRFAGGNFISWSGLLLFPAT